MSLFETPRISLHAFEIIHRDLKDNDERILVAQILNNYYTRGLLWDEDSGTDSETIALTELIVMTNCLRKIQCATKEKESISK